MSAIGTVVVRRPGGGYRDRVRKYRIHIDGAYRAEIKAGEDVSFVVPPGKHSVVARIDKMWGSQEVLVDVAPGQVHLLHVAPGGPAWSAFFQLFTPNSYLKLRAESSYFGGVPPTN